MFSTFTVFSDSHFFAIQLLCSVLHCMMFCLFSYFIFGNVFVPCLPMIMIPMDSILIDINYQSCSYSASVCSRLCILNFTALSIYL